MTLDGRMEHYFRTSKLNICKMKEAAAVLYG